MTCAAPTVPRIIMLTQGETLDVAFTVSDPRGGLLDLSGASIYLTVKARLDDSGAVIVKRSALAGGSIAEIEPLDQVTYRGQFLVHFGFVDTATLVFRVSYVYDVWVVLPTGEHYCVCAASPFKITPTISRF